MKKLLLPLLIVGSVVFSVPVMGASKAPDDKKASKEEKKMAVVSATSTGQKSEVDKVDARAMYQLGLDWLHRSASEAVELEANKRMAVTCFLAAASEGYAPAMCHLGECCLDDSTWDKAEAWYARAYKAFLVPASNGDACAMFMLSQYYANGFGGVDKDLNAAGVMAAQAFKAGFQPTEANTIDFGKIIEYTHRKEAEARRQADEARRQETEKMTVESFKKAADLGNADAMLYRSYCYWHGYEVEQNKAEAERWYERAVDAGFTPVDG
jgi:TPR repeat protein